MLDRRIAEHRLGLRRLRDSSAPARVQESVVKVIASNFIPVD